MGNQKKSPLRLAGRGLDGEYPSAWLHTHRIGDLFVLFDLIEVEIAIDLVAAFVDDAHVGHVFLLGGNAAQTRADGSQFGRSAWLPMHNEQPGISVRAPAVPKTP